VAGEGQESGRNVSPVRLAIPSSNWVNGRPSSQSYFESMNLKRACFGLVALGLVAGCGTTATIKRVDGSAVEARIVGGDDRKLYLEQDGEPLEVERRDVRDISHPGNAASIVGGILAGYGVINIAVGAPQCNDKGAAFCTGVFLPEAVGLPMLIWGIATHAASVSAAKTPPTEQAGIVVAPIVPMGPGQPAGAGVVGRF
jgi:hypothetical protein